MPKLTEKIERHERLSGVGTWIALVLLLLLGVLLRVAHWNPGFGADDSNYMNNAARMAEGEPPVAAYHNHTVRFGYQLFLATGMWLFGIDTAVCRALGIVVFVFTAILIFFITRRLSGAIQGLLAVFLYVFFPLDITLSTRVRPDPLMTLLALAASLIYLQAKAQMDHTRQFCLAFGAGFVLGLAVSVKEAAVLVGIVFAIDLVARVRERRCVYVLPGIALGAIAVLGLEMLGFLAWTGDALFRFQTFSQIFLSELWWASPLDVQRTVGDNSSAFHINSQTLRAGSWNLLDPGAAYYALVAMNTTGEFGTHGYLLLFGALLAMNRRSKDSVFPLIFCGFLAAYLSFGSVNLSRYVRMWHSPRYFHSVMIMGCVLMGIEFLGTDFRTAARNLKLRSGIVMFLGIVFVCVSLWAAKETPWSGTVLVAKWLGSLENSRRADLVLREDFVQRQALEHRRTVREFATVSDEVAYSPEALAAKLAGRGLVVRRRRVTASGELQEVKRILSQHLKVSLRKEEIYGGPWPPYKRWIGIGAQEYVIGYILWPEDKDQTTENSARPEQSVSPQ